jgi:hypothetical protein
MARMTVLNFVLPSINWALYWELQHSKNQPHQKYRPETVHRLQKLNAFTNRGVALKPVYITD